MKAIVRTGASAALIRSATNHFLPTVSALAIPRYLVTCAQNSNHASNNSTPVLRAWVSKQTGRWGYFPRSSTVRLSAITSERSMPAFYCTAECEAKNLTGPNDTSLGTHGCDEQHQDSTWTTDGGEGDESIAKCGQASTGASGWQDRDCSSDDTGDEPDWNTNMTQQSFPGTSDTLCGAEGTTYSSLPSRNNPSSSVTPALDFVKFPAAQTDTVGDLEPADLETVDAPSVDRHQPYTGPVRHAYVDLRNLVDHSETLQKLVHLGVDLHKVSRKRHAANLIAKLDFESQVKEKLMFLLDVGVTRENLGHIISVNPFLLAVDLERLERRVQYLLSKKFKEEEIAVLVSRAPYLLQLSVQRLDNKLGWLQRNLQTTATQTRHIVVHYPRVLTVSLARIKANLQAVQHQLGFSPQQLRSLAMGAPRMLSRDKYKIITVFDYVHNEMGIPHHIIVCSPQVFNSRRRQLSERHQFLQKLGRAQYDPALPGYIPLDKLYKLPDTVFCTQLAKVTIQEYQDFLKTL
ncbi:transcription termination factor 3, mitochondrial-like [Branchiostoma floridae x Branchiostoma japonicum]